MPVNGPRREFTSWKEIAEYLGVTVRTAQKWEEDRGLPIHRLPGGRGRVAAYADEIDAWKNSPPSAGEAPAEAGSRTRRWIAWTAAAAVVLAALGAFVATVRPFEDRRPSSFRVDTYDLFVFDKSGRELFRHLFDTPLVLDAYAPRNMARVDRRQVRFVDLDGDRRLETLFMQEAVPAEAGQALFCFDDRGAVRWSFEAKRTVSSRDETFPPPYQPRQFTVVQLDSRGRKAVVVTSSHLMYYPSQVALLSPDGKLLREYWHSGALLQVETADYDRDGTDEIYLSGINNARRQATLVVLDPRTMEGASEEEQSAYRGCPAERRK